MKPSAGDCMWWFPEMLQITVIPFAQNIGHSQHAACVYKPKSPTVTSPEHAK